ncbi:hypothetical protein P170DRAFT_456429 [Aspergillus steynii IBT 23096]|uniref:Aminoglycoside phosphotransferase domain-containing protein n=1 Tax=Aspergillus steynii IBT 23096 TaxID=1392250 RepID=A0A2I2G3Y5_9EURO|nr:uncharacterized protein P170DRAFT_456429 [Aspergillus steynii IBT 23096]PLB47592.1 hypothetical protein P170DRAFT_456429 [Aspergillus steynii IBT 23096]
MAKEHKFRATSCLLPLRLWIGKRLFAAVGPRGVRVSPSRFIKGPCPRSELAALKFVAEHTTVPVPRIFNSHLYDGIFYIEMGYVRGMNLEEAWYYEGIFASAELDSVLDHRVGSHPFGPFTSHEAFHSCIRAAVPIENCSEVIGTEVTKCHSRHYQSCFTHADIAPRNIMVDNGKVSAIVDWQFGGWYPEYWEYTKAHYAQIDRPEWFNRLENAMERYDDELNAERILWSRLDEPQLLLRGKEHLILSPDRV